VSILCSRERPVRCLGGPGIAAVSNRHVPARRSTPHPVATLLLPDDAGRVTVKITQVWLSDHLLEACAVELPMWSGWSQKVGGGEIRGTAPSSIVTWAPLEALRFSDKVSKAITQVQMQALTAPVPCTT
jgi:hypothetical protein